MDYKDIERLKDRYTREDFESILLMVEQDLKINNLRFNKSIPKMKFLEVLNIAEGVFSRLWKIAKKIRGEIDYGY